MRLWLTRWIVRSFVLVSALALASCLVIVDDDVDFGFHDVFDERDWHLILLVDGDRSYTIRRGYTLHFASDDELEGRADCNTYSATFRLYRNGGLSIHDLAASRVFCGEGSLESVYFDNLLRVDAYRQRGDDLLLYDASGDLLLHFEED
jgi:heat shock protein HslJ